MLIILSLPHEFTKRDHGFFEKKYFNGYLFGKIPRVLFYRCPFVAGVPTMAMHGNESRRTVVPSRDKAEQADDQRCQSILWNLIEAFQKSTIPPTALIRELFQTERCLRQMPELTKVRAMFQADIGQESLDDILRFQVPRDPCAKERCAQALFRHATWTQKMLVRELPLGSWVYYHSVYRMERTLKTCFERFRTHRLCSHNISMGSADHTSVGKEPRARCEQTKRHDAERQ